MTPPDKPARLQHEPAIPAASALSRLSGARFRLVHEQKIEPGQAFSQDAPTFAGEMAMAAIGFDSSRCAPGNQGRQRLGLGQVGIGDDQKPTAAR